MNEFILLIPITLICWSLAAWLFWRWDLGGYRSEREAKQNAKPNRCNGGDKGKIA